MILLRILPRQRFLVAVLLFCTIILCAGQTDAQDRKTPDDKLLKSQIVKSFAATHDGWSSDEVILNDELNEAFVGHVRSSLPDADPETINWMLVNLRKAGKLNVVKTTKRHNHSLESVEPLAEIAMRTVIDRHGVSTDRIICNPKMRAEFNDEVKRFAADADLYLARKAAFKLRKSRSLRPELIARIADWNKAILTLSVQEITSNPGQVPAQPGVYIFRDKTGYLYIGQADNLRKRLKTHLDGSHNESLASYLKQNLHKNISIEIHAFDSNSPARKVMVRRAYESELIRTRKPRFNILP